MREKENLQRRKKGPESGRPDQGLLLGTRQEKKNLSTQKLFNLLHPGGGKGPRRRSFRGAEEKEGRTKKKRTSSAGAEGGHYSDFGPPAITPAAKKGKKNAGGEGRFLKKKPKKKFRNERGNARRWPRNPKPGYWKKMQLTTFSEKNSFQKRKKREPSSSGKEDSLEHSTT